MATSSKIRVGIVGVNPQRGFALIAHVPALQALPEFEISAVCTTRQDSAEAAARHYGIPLAFSNPEELARNPKVDLVTVSVKVPDHFRPVMAAIDAGKHVYCEWPLGRDTDEAERMLAAAEHKGIRHAVGLQGRMSPVINYARDLVTQGYVGRVLSATMIACAPNWGASIDRAYQADGANGANLLTITGGHTIDALCHCLGEFRELSAFVVSQRDHIPVENTGELVAKTSPDQLVVNGIVGDRAVVSFQVRGGVTRGDPFPGRDPWGRGRSPTQRHLTELYAVAGIDPEGRKGRGRPRRSAGLRQIPLGTAGRVFRIPLQRRPALPKFGEAIRDGKAFSPGFDAAVTRHRLLGAIERASDTGEKQVIRAA